MSSTLRVQALGRLAFEADGAPLPCASRKGGWLAAYVLLRREAQSRAGLAGLIWGAESPRHALGSLRVALTKLPAPVLACLDVSRDTIGVAGDARYILDLDTFSAHCASGEAHLRESALPLYAGELFQGAEDDVEPEFCDWLIPERERVKQVAHDAHLRVAKELYEQGERARARSVVDAWLRHDPAAESMHRLLMNWLPPDQALAHYEVYRRARAVARGAAPSEEMAAHAERLRRGHEPAAREAPARLTAATSFFGRTDELVELRGLLADPACRLLTIHGLGGVGKTRLAGALTDLEAGSFPDGVHVVPLEGLHTPGLFAPTLARACGLQPSGDLAPLDLVASFLGDHVALLALDNLEHLLSDDDTGPGSIPAQIAALLRATGPRVKILATSREPLRLQEEWVYELEGLAHPRAGDAEADDAQSYPAVQFFAQRARQAYVGFSLAAELPNVMRICETVEGLPLGLELAASWVRNVPCAEIAASLHQRATEMRNRHVNRAERHHCLGAVVAYSWERLPVEQRDALSGVAVLRGTFSREAAEQVAHASVRSLSALTEKSLLQRAGGGRWHVHEVVRQFAWQQPGATPKARTARQAAVARQRDAYFMSYLRVSCARLDSPEEADARLGVELEIANIRAAWLSCAQSGDLEALEGAAAAWFGIMDSNRFIDEACTAAKQWLDAALAAGNTPSAARARIHLANFEDHAGDLPRALATIEPAVAFFENIPGSPRLAEALIEKAAILSHMGRLDEARATGARAIEIAQALADDALLAQALTVQGFMVIRMGKGEEARALQRRALEIFTRIGKPSAIARVHNNLALADNFLGDYRAAEAGYERALRIWKELRMTRVAGLAMHNLGVVSQRLREYDRALERYAAGLEMLKRAGDRKMIAINLMSTGDSLVRAGRAGEARAPLAEALRIAERDGHALPIPYARVMMAHAEVTLGNLREAAAHLARALDDAERNNYTDVLAEGVVNCARLLAAAAPERSRAALDWMREIVRLPETSARVRDDAKDIVRHLAPRHPDAGDGPGRTLKELVAEARKAIAGLPAGGAAQTSPRAESSSLR